MKGDLHEHEDELRTDETTTTKRKMEDTILLAKQKAQEIAARLVSNASESKRPRIADHDDESPDPVPYSNSVSNNTPFPVPFVPQTGQYETSQSINKRISIPTGKVGLIIGKGGERIKYLQSQAGAKIQITKDLEADPHSRTRDVELMGSLEQITRAEELIIEMISQSDTAGAGSAPSTNYAANPVQPGGEQLIMKIPNHKVALIIGKGGESIRTMQARSGARIQIIPLHLPPGDTSTERNVYIDGLPDQIESAKELINEVINGKRLMNPSSNSYAYPPSSGGYSQPPPEQQPQYGYAQPGGYAQPPAAASYYGNYPGTGWDQSNQAAQQTAGYGYYGQSNPSYSYGQNYSQQPPNYGQPNSAQLQAPDQAQPYPGSGFGAPPPPQQASNPDGTQSSSAYPYADYSQSMGNPQPGYWAYPSNANQPPSQPVYDQSGYYQAAYGGQQAHVPSYGEDGQSVPAAADHVQPSDPAHEVPVTNGFGHSSVNGAQRVAAGNSDGKDSVSSVQETGDDQAQV